MGGIMTPAQALVANLQARGIELQACGDALRFRPKAAVTPDLASRLKAHKSELLRILADAVEPDLPPRPPARRGYVAELARRDGQWVWRQRRPDAADAAYWQWVNQR